jgi:hypothetical protein
MQNVSCPQKTPNEECFGLDTTSLTKVKKMTWENYVEFRTSVLIVEIRDSKSVKILLISIPRFQICFQAQNPARQGITAVL